MAPRRASIVIWVALAGLLVWPRAAAAEDPARAHPTYVAVGVGGYLALAGLGDLGPAAEVEVYPSGWGRFGGRAAYYGFDYDFAGALVTAGVTYQGASSRPHLHLALHADLALTVDDPAGTRVGAGGGVQSQLWVLGPVALGLDATAHLLFNRDDIALALASTTTLRLSF